LVCNFLFLIVIVRSKNVVEVVGGSMFQFREPIN